MTIVPFLRDRVFGPQDIQAMSTAFDDVCKFSTWPIKHKAKENSLRKRSFFLRTRANVTRRSCDRTLREIVHGPDAWPATLVSAAQCGAL